MCTRQPERQRKAADGGDGSGDGESDANDGANDDPDDGAARGTTLLYPFLPEDDTNQASSLRRFEAVEVPDLFPAAPEHAEHLAHLTFGHGDFATLYRSGAYRGHFHLVVTNFFIDTAENVRAVVHVAVVVGIWQSNHRSVASRSRHLRLFLLHAATHTLLTLVSVTRSLPLARCSSSWRRCATPWPAAACG
jgi:hypothetical protein